MNAQEEEFLIGDSNVMGQIRVVYLTILEYGATKLGTKIHPERHLGSKVFHFHFSK